MVRTSPPNNMPFDMLSELSDGQIETTLYRMLHACENVPALTGQLEPLLRSWSFDSYCYVAVGRDNKRLEAPKRILSNLPEALTTAYDDKSYHCWDVVADYAYHNTQAIYYSDLQASLGTLPFETEVQNINRKIYNLYRLFGYHDFYVMPDHTEELKAFLMIGCREENEGGGAACKFVQTGEMPMAVGVDQTRVSAGFEDGIIRIHQNNGRYVLPASVNGVKIDFLIDTGADNIALCPKDAARIGFDIDLLTFNQACMTANGETNMAFARLDSLVAGPIILAYVPAYISKVEMGYSVLGQTFLSCIRSIEIAEGVMSLKV